MNNLKLTLKIKLQKKSGFCVEQRWGGGRGKGHLEAEDPGCSTQALEREAAELALSSSSSRRSWRCTARHVCSRRWFGKLSPSAKAAGASGCPCLPCSPHEVEKFCHQHPVLYGDVGSALTALSGTGLLSVPVGTVQPLVTGGPAASARGAWLSLGSGLLELRAQGYRFQFQLRDIESGFFSP